MKNIFLFGECMIELMTASQEPSSNTMQQSFAGDVFNTAVYLKRTFSDVNVHLVTAVGKDNFSQNMVEYFEKEQIGTDFVFESNSKISGLYAITLDEVGERSFTYWRNDSAARQIMQHIDKNVTNALSQGDIFFFSGISLAVIEPNARDDFWLMVEQVKASGVKIVFDPNYRARMWDNPEQAKVQFEKAFSLANIALPGVDDFQQLYNISTSQGVYEFCQPYQFDELIIKNGEAGIFCYTTTEQFKFDITPVTKVIDTTSAGDSFNGVYLGATTTKLTLHESIKLASKAAGFVIQHKGAIVEYKIYKQFIKEQLNKLS